MTIGSAGKAADLITQTIVMCRENEKAGLLERELEKQRDKRRLTVAKTFGDVAAAPQMIEQNQVADKKAVGWTFKHKSDALGNWF